MFRAVRAYTSDLARSSLHCMRRSSLIMREHSIYRSFYTCLHNIITYTIAQRVTGLVLVQHALAVNLVVVGSVCTVRVPAGGRERGQRDRRDHEGSPRYSGGRRSVFVFAVPRAAHAFARITAATFTFGSNVRSCCIEHASPAAFTFADPDSSPDSATSPAPRRRVCA